MRTIRWLFQLVVVELACFWAGWVWEAVGGWPPVEPLRAPPAPGFRGRRGWGELR